MMCVQILTVSRKSLKKLKMRVYAKTWSNWLPPGKRSPVPLKDGIGSET